MKSPGCHLPDTTEQDGGPSVAHVLWAALPLIRSHQRAPQGTFSWQDDPIQSRSKYPSSRPYKNSDLQERHFCPKLRINDDVFPGIALERLLKTYIILTDTKMFLFPESKRVQVTRIETIKLRIMSKLRIHIN